MERYSSIVLKNWLFSGALMGLSRASTGSEMRVVGPAVGWMVVILLAVCGATRLP